MSFSDKPDLDELAHFGVKGMRWGHHNPQVAGGGGGGHAAPVAKSSRQLNKEFRAQANAKRNSEIDKARETFKSGEARSRYLAAKAQYKADKQTIGSAAARAKFNEVKQKNLEDYNAAQQAKSGKETALTVLAIAGGITLVALAGRR